MSFVWMALVGLVVGLIARFVMPGAQSMGLIMTALLGIAGSFVAGFLGQAVGLYHAGQGPGFIGSIVGALILLFVVGKLRKS
ncbi:MAG: GlsB/YeaQ/YmgE family stress response membrane protein [Ideonella sp.]|nr:GlsB/YeaQ/YmgE family stress response membrane protein [Ideonella sp.]